jgi:hypothetical protein
LFDNSNYEAHYPRPEKYRFNLGNRMNPIWHNTYLSTSQATSLRGRVAVSLEMVSIIVTKDFVAHDPGGSDG